MFELFATNEQTAISVIARNDAARGIAGLVEMGGCATKQVPAVVTHHGTATRIEAGGESTDDLALEIANVVSLEWQLILLPHP
ncbi:MAG: hypothetical protein ROO76_20750 [Terriglobia bacterium]|nr:hypothetical protein [Terriglobia bacterium]